jgi:integrase
MPKGMIKVKRHIGVYYLVSSERVHKGQPDKCYYINFSEPGKKGTTWEKIGWGVDGYSAALAAQIRAERVRAVRHGDELPRKRKEITFGQAWEKYDEWLDIGKKRPRDDRLLYKNHLKEPLEDISLSKISPLDLEKLKIDLTKKGLAPASVKHCLILVRQVINKAIAWDLWHGENPMKKVATPKLANRRERYLNPDEAQRLLASLSIHSHQWYCIALMSLHTGMRAGEIFALRWGHIDLDNSLIHIADPKNNESRKAYMTPTLKAVIQGLESGPMEDLVFKSSRGEQIKEVSDTFPKVVDKLGFNDGITDRRQKVTFHTLRHTFASWLALEGTPILTIKELLGHKSLAMTERYSHLSPGHKQGAMGFIEKRFNLLTDQGNRMTLE